MAQKSGFLLGYYSSICFYMAQMTIIPCNIPYRIPCRITYIPHIRNPYDSVTTVPDNTCAFNSIKKLAGSYIRPDDHSVEPNITIPTDSPDESNKTIPTDSPDKLNKPYQQTLKRH